LRVLILYTELAGYVLGNISSFLKSYNTAEVLIIHYPVNPEAPFNFSDLYGIKFVDKSQINDETLIKLVNDFNPNAVLCSGWADKTYLRIVGGLPQKTKRVICLDNQWKASLKQYILVLIAPFWLLKIFKYAWVPGEPQKQYAMKLGFKATNVFTGLYPADSEFYGHIGRLKLSNKKAYPKQMISIARYIAQKDLPTLWHAFIAANNDTGNQWTLNCFGFGELFESRIIDPYIHHLGFKQPRELEKYIIDAGVYVLPSIYEPWGVAVHEMALSALPMVLSDKVGAASMFLSNKNGFAFQAADVKALEKVLYKFMQMDDEQLWTMAEASYNSGLTLTSNDWSLTLKTIIDK